jgi:glycosyltransferase involved in cell wall biosynthesis
MAGNAGVSHVGAATPLVTVGVPVRNGAATLEKALASIARQTYPNLEIVISDNASDDGTAEIIDRFARTDDRVRVLRQEQLLTMFGNHAATYREARGRYLIWLAHDDLLTEDLVARLVPVMEADDDVVLAFGEVHLFTDYEHLSDRRPLEHHFDTRGIPTWRRLWRDRNSGWEAKGLIRRSALASYRWWEHAVSPDWPLLTHLLVVGEVREVPGAVLLVGYRPDLKTTEERAALQSYSSVERFSTVKLSWRSALAARDAGRQVGRRSLLPLDFALTLGGLVWAKRRSYSPLAVDAWRRRFSRLRRAAS